MDRPGGIVDVRPDPGLYPFESRWFDSSVGPLHYVDEGAGRPLLLLHGNPDWSFIYRHIILGLRERFRCIAPDYPGFGLSVHPSAGYRFTPGEHAGVVQELVVALELQDAVVMGGDWAGPIGMDTASRMPERFSGLVMGNTWFWPADDIPMRAFSLTTSSRPLGALIRRRNFFVTTVMKRTINASLSPAEFAHYVDVAPTPESRAGMVEFPRQIRAARPWLTELETRVEATLTDRPLLLFRGAKDPAVGRQAVVDRWLRTFPQASVVVLPDAGHFFQEDAPDRIVEAIAEAHARA